MSKQKILEVNNVSKLFKNNYALRDFSLNLNSGEILGLLGPNGAGKTTFISILSGIIQDYSGSILLNSEKYTASGSQRNIMGIVPQEMAFYEELSAMENLLFWGSLYNIPPRKLKKRAEELLEQIGLMNRAKEPVKNFSGGMKRRLNIAIGLFHKPELLLLDEPTVGIDVQAKVNILEIIKDAGQNGTTVIFTTHQLSEVEEICSDIAIMDKGSVIARGTLEDLIRDAGQEEIVDIKGDFKASEINRFISENNSFSILSAADNSATFSVKETTVIPEILRTLFINQAVVRDIKIKTPSLETLFLKLTGRSLRE